MSFHRAFSPSVEMCLFQMEDLSGHMRKSRSPASIRTALILSRAFRSMPPLVRRLWQKEASCGRVVTFTPRPLASQGLSYRDIEKKIWQVAQDFRQSGISIPGRRVCRQAGSSRRASLDPRIRRSGRFVLKVGGQSCYEPCSYLG